MELNEFKEKLGKPLSELTIHDLEHITADEDMMLALNDLDIGLSISEEVMSSNDDADVRSEFAPLVYHHRLYGSQKELAQIFAQYDTDNDSENLKRSIDAFLAKAHPLGKLSAYLVVLTTVDGYDVPYDDIRSVVKDCEAILFSLEFDKGFPIICDIMDMLYSIQEAYYKRYQMDVIAEDTEKMNDFVSRLNDFTQPIYDKMEERIESGLPEDITPKDIGALDITQFKDALHDEKE